MVLKNIMNMENENFNTLKKQIDTLTQAIMHIMEIKNENEDKRIPFSSEEAEKNEALMIMNTVYEDLLLLKEFKKAFPHIEKLKELDSKRFIVAEDTISVKKDDMIILAISFANSKFNFIDEYGTRKATILAGLFEDIGDVALDNNAQTIEKTADGMLISFIPEDMQNAYLTMVSVTMFQDTKTEEVNAAIQKHFPHSLENISIKIDLGLTIGKVLNKVFGNRVIYPPSIMGNTVTKVREFLKRSQDYGTGIIVNKLLVEKFLQNKMNIVYREKLNPVKFENIDGVHALCDINIDFRNTNRYIAYKELYDFYILLKERKLQKIKAKLNLTDVSLEKKVIGETVRKHITGLLNILFTEIKNQYSNDEEKKTGTNEPPKMDGFELELITDIKKELVVHLQKLFT